VDKRKKRRRRARRDSDSEDRGAGSCFAAGAAPLRADATQGKPGGHSTSLMADGDRLPRLRRGVCQQKAGQQAADG